MNLSTLNSLNCKSSPLSDSNRIEDPAVVCFIDYHKNFSEEASVTKSGTLILHKNRDMPDRQINQVEWKNQKLQLLSNGNMIHESTFQNHDLTDWKTISIAYLVRDDSGKIICHQNLSKQLQPGSEVTVSIISKSKALEENFDKITHVFRMMECLSESDDEYELPGYLYVANECLKMN